MNKIEVVNPKESILNERYRPGSVRDCILRPDVKENFLNMIQSQHVGNLLFYGPAGTGKTTTAKAICHDLGMEWIIINASSERTLEVIRSTIRSFASTSSFSGNRKCVILDEADNLPHATQTAFRACIEEYSQNCSFIFTCNYPNKIIDPLKSRLVGVDFSVDVNTELEMKLSLYERLCGILNNESITYDEDVLLNLVTLLYPDARRMINLLDYYSTRNGTIDEGILVNIKDDTVDALYELLSAVRSSSNFRPVRQWCADHARSDLSGFYTKMYHAVERYVSSADVPKAILIINDAQRYDQIVPDKEPHLAALCIELVAECEFK